MRVRRRGVCTRLAHLLYGLMLIQLSSCGEEGDPCTVKPNLPGVCRLSSQCEPHVDKYIKMNILTGQEVPSCGFGTLEEIVCCPIAECCPGDTRGDTTTTRTIQPTPTTRVNVGPDPNRPAARACRNYETGTREPSLTPHILKGIPVDDGVYPHMAAIAINSIGTISFRCGGSLISNRHVLTAAHCVNDVNEPPVYVRLGSVNIDKVNEFFEDVNITNISIHQDYSSISKYNDIAILELEREVKFSLYIYPACLELDTADPPKSSKLFVAGWGVMNQSTRTTSKILLRAPLEIVPLQTCNSSILQQPTSQKYLREGVLGTLICAADTHRQEADACQGDSGGPLVLETDLENNQFTILGIISAGFGCATKTPGLYTRVASYLDYIESVVWPNNVVPDRV